MADSDAGPVTGALRAAGRFLLRLPLPLALLLGVLWALVIWDLSSQATPLRTGVSPTWELLSNLAHAPVFGVLALFLGAALLRERDGDWPRPRAARIALVLLLTAGYGAVDEWHQGRVPGRDASALDALTDLVGAALVLWIAYGLGRGALRERELLARLGLGVLLCLGSAALALLS